WAVQHLGSPFFWFPKIRLISDKNTQLWIRIHPLLALVAMSTIITKQNDCDVHEFINAFSNTEQKTARRVPVARIHARRDGLRAQDVGDVHNRFRKVPLSFRAESPRGRLALSGIFSTQGCNCAVCVYRASRARTFACGP